MITIDLTVDPDTGDHAYRAFCECGWADPEGWSHSDVYPGRPDSERSVSRAWQATRRQGDAHLAEVAGDSGDHLPGHSLLSALPIPTTDQSGYAR